MASIKFGAIVTDMRGKLGGHVFQKGNQSSVLKTYAKPRRNVTPIVKFTQSVTNDAINAYSELSFSEKQQWQALAINQSFKTRFGDRQAYTGRQLYLYLFNNLKKAGFATVPDLATYDPTIFYTEWTEFQINVTDGDFISDGASGIGANRLNLKVISPRKLLLSPDISKFSHLDSSNRFDYTRDFYYSLYESYYGPITLESNIYMACSIVNPSGFRGAYQIRLAEMIS